MRPSPKSLTRRPINSAAEPHGRTAAGSLDQNDSVATNGPEIGARAAARAFVGRPFGLPDTPFEKGLPDGAVRFLLAISTT